MTFTTIKDFFEKTGFSQEQQQKILSRVAEVLLDNPDDTEIVIRFANLVIDFNNFEAEERLKPKPPLLYTTFKNACLTIAVGDKTISTNCRYIRIMKDGRVIGIKNDDSRIVSNITNAIIEQPSQEGSRE